MAIHFRIRENLLDDFCLLPQMIQLVMHLCFYVVPIGRTQKKVEKEDRENVSLIQKIQYLCTSQGLLVMKKNTLTNVLIQPLFQQWVNLLMSLRIK